MSDYQELKVSEKYGPHYFHRDVSQWPGYPWLAERLVEELAIEKELDLVDPEPQWDHHGGTFLSWYHSDKWSFEMEVKVRRAAWLRILQRRVEETI